VTDTLRQSLIGIANGELQESDSSHDFLHAQRVLANAEKITKEEGGDLDVIIPAALFHDLVCYPKNSPENAFSAKHSAEKATIILKNLDGFPKEKVHLVESAILTSTFIHGKKPDNIEDIIVHDADMLDAVGAIAIARTFGSSGVMGRPFYHAEDPFGQKREYEQTKYALDHFYQRLLVVKDRMRTKTGKGIAERRTKILRVFLEELEKELRGE